MSAPLPPALADEDDIGEGGASEDELLHHHDTFSSIDDFYAAAPELKIGDDKLRVIAHFWRQLGNEKDHEQLRWTKQQIRTYVEGILQTREVETKTAVRDEVFFIANHLRQRRCKNYCKRTDSLFVRRIQKVLRTMNRSVVGRQGNFCTCGLPEDQHTQEALRNSSKEWEVVENTDLTLSFNFGNFDIPGHYNYLDSPSGTRKYLRVDDLSTDPKHLWTMLRRHWQLQTPNLVISVTGGDVRALKQNTRLHKAFKDGLLKSAVTTSAWVLTEGLCCGASKEIGDIFQEDLQRTQWAERKDHANIPLIAFAPWGVLADRHPFLGINVGTGEAVYQYRSADLDDDKNQLVPNALDPHHTIYLLHDDGTNGRYDRESVLRNKLEAYIKKNTTLRALGGSDVKTPTVVLVMGGDKFTLSKLHRATSPDVGISVVIVDDSGPIADLLANIFKAMESHFPRFEKKPYGWSEAEEYFLTEYIQRNSEKLATLLATPDAETHLREFLKARHLVEVFGVLDGDINDLDKAILQAIFGGFNDISVQLNLALAMDRCDVAAESIFIESRKKELRAQRDMLQNALFLALKTNRTQFVELFLDQDYGGELEFSRFLTAKRLHSLHKQNFRSRFIMGAVLKSITKRNSAGDYLVDEDERYIMPQVGRIIYKLLGPKYRLLYQQKEFREVTDETLPLRLSRTKEEQAIWHLLIWAVLANQKQVAELFLFESSCKLGCALIAFRLYGELAKKAEKLFENELAQELKQNATYFEELAMSTLTELYSIDRQVAYACLVSAIPFNLGTQVTPMSLAHDGVAKRFLSHSCCQTFIILVWMKYMEVDTAYWKLLPIFMVMPWFNVPFIIFDKAHLSYGSYGNVQTGSSGLRGTITTSRRKGVDTVIKLTAPQAAGPPISVSPPGAGDTESLSGDVDTGLEGSLRPGQAGNKRVSRSLSEKLAHARFCLSNYYTAPVTIFFNNLISYLVFLGLFSHLVLTELAPVDHYSQVTIYEWLVFVWVTAITLEEINQIMLRDVDGPLLGENWREFEPHWRRSFYWNERLAIVLRLHPLSSWLSEYWNIFDLLMLSFFIATVVLRFSLSVQHFGYVRICYSTTLMIFYFRMLRVGYILQDIGPRVIVIAALLRDLFFFIIILAVFILGFGISFQAILNPGISPSVVLLADILWRSYWQMFGELFVEDISGGMGLAVDNRTCVQVVPGISYPPDVELCQDWGATVLLGIFMLITNILLLNLLIAIFSHSFDQIQQESKMWWQYNMYGLVHEYYHQSRLPLPFNILELSIRLLIWLVLWPRKWAYKLALKRRNYTAKIHVTTVSANVYNGEVSGLDGVELEAEEELEGDALSWFYYTKTQERQTRINHLCQEEIYRDEDLEEIAYKRHLRGRGHTINTTDQKLDTHGARLRSIASELQDLKQLSSSLQQTREGPSPLTQQQQQTLPTHLAVPSASSSTHSSREMEALRLDLQKSNEKINHMGRQMDRILRSVDTLLNQARVDRGATDDKDASGANKAADWGAGPTAKSKKTSTAVKA